MLRCAKCKAHKPSTEFSPNPRNKSGRTSYCKPCHNHQQRARHSYEKARDSQLRLNYGITLAQYDAMLEAQGGVCDICKEPAKLQLMGRGKIPRSQLRVDHCHNSGKVRALLCNSCNSALAYMREDTKLALKMIAYLEKHSA